MITQVLVGGQKELHTQGRQISKDVLSSVTATKELCGAWRGTDVAQQKGWGSMPPVA